MSLELESQFVPELKFDEKGRSYILENGEQWPPKDWLRSHIIRLSIGLNLQTTDLRSVFNSIENTLHRYAPVLSVNEFIQRLPDEISEFIAVNPKSPRQD